MTDTDRPDTSRSVEGEDITGHVAIIGMACRFPGADDPESFWQNLLDGVEAITHFPEQQVPNSTERFSPARGLVSDPDQFDAGYFGCSPREARMLSPQHRVLLECGVQALEDAGYDPARYPGVIGVYAGGTETGYAQLLKANRDQLPSVTDWEILIANGADFLVPRLSYKLGLTGPAVTVQSACATSLVAVHLAVQGLLAGDCDLALAGGIAVHAPMKTSHYSPGGILSADGRCRAFATDAAGTVGSDGAGLVVLKRLSDALADGDFVHAVIRGTAVNNDGGNRIGFTAPSVSGQARVIRDAQLVACVEADSIGYVEAHGTATPLGDPIEVAALTEAFRHDSDRTGFCGIGSVKSNIGHTDAAAGAAGLIKTALALRHGQIPASLHLDRPNPEIDFATSPFRPVSVAQPWPAGSGPRRAGVSAFGIGGTNAHVIVEEAPLSARHHAECDTSDDPQLIVLSARSPRALRRARQQLAEYLSRHSELALRDVAWTLQVGRSEHAYRQRLVVTGLEDAIRQLSDAGEEVLAPPPRASNVVLLFGSQPADLEARLPDDCAATVARCLALAAPLLYIEGDQDEGRLAVTVAGRAVLGFARQYAVAELWSSWGLRPAAVLGTGTGALVAAAVAGACSIAEAIQLVATRIDAPDAAFADLAERIRWQPPAVPVNSAATGQVLSMSAAESWIDAVKDGSQTDAALARLLAEGGSLVEAGPGELLARARRLPEGAGGQPLLALLPEAEGSADARPALLAALGAAWTAGASVRWEAVHADRPHRVPLPTYPFERERYLVNAAQPEGAPAIAENGTAAEAATAAQRATAESLDHPAGVEGIDPHLDRSTVDTVVRAFAATLEQPAAGEQDSFFDLGGDSLIAVDLMNDLSRIFGIELDLLAVFDAPTPVDLAAVIDGQLGALATGN